MNDRLSSAADATPGDPPSATAAASPIDPTLPPTTRLGGFEIRRLIARSASTAVYLATDLALALPVAIQEYLPARLVRRDAGLHLRAADAWHDDLIDRGLRAFTDETRLLARCEHPALVRVKQLFEARGSAYRVMPVYTGQRLSDLRHEMIGAPDETALRALLDGLLGAIEAIHRSGEVHGGITPANILVLADDRPLLLGPGAAGREIGSDLVDSLMATLESNAGAGNAAGASTATPPDGAARDLYMLADTLRFCITGEAPAAPGTLRTREPLAEAIAREFAPPDRPRYSAALTGTLDAALSTFAEDRPLTAAQFRDWLVRGVPGGPVRLAPLPKPVVSPAAADAAGVDATQPMAPWPDPVPLSGDPITPDRPPWVSPAFAPGLQRAGASRRRLYQVVMATGLAVLAVAVLAVATGAWHLSPDIRLEPAVERGAAVAPAATPTALVPETPVAVPPPPLVVPPDAPPAAPLTRAEDPAATLAAQPPAAGTPAPMRAVQAVRPERVQSAAPAGGPRAACAGRTEFALYRCMQQQCQAQRWATHPQCVRLRNEDRVD